MPACEERRGHAVRRPRLLRARLEHQADLHRDDRQPQRVHAGRIRRQHQPEHRALRLVADRHAALFAVARSRARRGRARASATSRMLRMSLEHEARSSSCSRGTCARAGRCSPTARARTRRATACRRPSAAWRSCRARPPCRRARSARRSESARSASRARCALRMSRWISPPLARLTLAIGSPVEKWTTSSTSMLVYGWPQRERNAASDESSIVHRTVMDRTDLNTRRPSSSRRSRGTAARR